MEEDILAQWKKYGQNTDRVPRDNSWYESHAETYRNTLSGWTEVTHIAARKPRVDHW